MKGGKGGRDESKVRERAGERNRGMGRRDRGWDDGREGGGRGEGAGKTREDWRVGEGKLPL